MRGYVFTIPNLPRDLYGYLREVGKAQDLSPWQVVILALRALEYVGREDPEAAINLVLEVKGKHPKP